MNEIEKQILDRIKSIEEKMKEQDVKLRVLREMLVQVELTKQLQNSNNN